MGYVGKEIGQDLNVKITIIISHFGLFTVTGASILQVLRVIKYTRHKSYRSQCPFNP